MQSVVWGRQVNDMFILSQITQTDLKRMRKESSTANLQNFFGAVLFSFASVCLRREWLGEKPSQTTFQN